MMQTVTNLAELDRMLNWVSHRFKVSDDEGRRALASFRYGLEHALPADPYSEEYRRAQMDLYLGLSGRASYSIENERTEFDVEAAARCPFPYTTKSAATISEQLIAQGWLLRHLQLPVGSRVVEFGPGWGNTTLQLASAGYRARPSRASSS
jgi:hypothetical protein